MKFYLSLRNPKWKSIRGKDNYFNLCKIKVKMLKISLNLRWNLSI